MRYAAMTDQGCGSSYDHDEVVTYEDATLIQWECRRCGAEGWTDLTQEPESDQRE
jgi:hypothetical protein